MDKLLKEFFEYERWNKAIQTGLDKDINKGLLKQLCDTEERIALYHQIKDGKYHVVPPHEAQIPKEDGSMRTVYVNEPKDRIVLSIINDMLFDLYGSLLISKTCKSYQKGIGCGKVVKQASEAIKNTHRNDIGVKLDLSKYFDSVKIWYIDAVFDKLELLNGEKSAIIDILREYYHNDTVIDMSKTEITKYTSLKQGCAVASFLADVILHHIDEEISSNFDVYYVRYSDDILIIGNEWQKAFDRIGSMLNDMELTLNPKKVEYLYKDRWFKFLGFTLKDDKISLGKSRIKTFQKEIEKRTVKSRKKNRKYESIRNSVYHYLYDGYQGYSWATGVLSIINTEEDINTLNTFVMDAIRASVTGKTKIGGLGVVTDERDRTILRGKGRHVKTNREKIPELKDYITLQCMRNALLVSKSAYDTLVSQL